MHTLSITRYLASSPPGVQLTEVDPVGMTVARDHAGQEGDIGRIASHSAFRSRIVPPRDRGEWGVSTGGVSDTVIESRGGSNSC